eukprot:1157580-Pelagomonas_calceolata.AAC.3
MKNSLYLTNLVEPSCSKSLTRGHGRTQMVAVISRMANKEKEQASSALLLTTKIYVEPNGAGITNMICRAELAAIAAAITHSYSHIAFKIASPLFITYINN